MDLTKLEEKIGIKFKNRELLKKALTHRSYLNEHPDYQDGSNERLEFLGDAVLEFLVTHFLFLKYPDSSEGRLTKYRSAVVSTKSLGEISRKFDLGRHLRMAKGEEVAGGRKRTSILADAFEALLGALFLDSGWENTEALLKKTVFPKISEVVKQGSFRDPKSLLQEKVQEEKRGALQYEVLGESGPDHQKLFVVGVFVAGKLWAKGQGKSKQDAEEDAARKALERYGSISSQHE
jgi:ribonuclease-3